MAGSQLKQLKEALKSKGLVGQTNVKRKNKKNAPSETRRDQEEKRKEIGKIRDEFNQFDNRINRSKHDFTVIAGGKFVKAGSKQHNDYAKSHSSVEKAMRLDYEAEKKAKNRAGGLVDRRFGESNRNLTQEEKMLQRFTRERQGSSKKNVFSLGSDDEYGDEDDADGGFALTHSGKKLDFADDDALGEASEKRFVDEDSVSDQPARKKSKKEVMAEVIAKSKFYKRQRQAAFEKAQEDIMDLDDDFADVLGEMRTSTAGKKNSGMTPKSQQDIEYDAKVRELTYERRAVPADRTKTDEELAQEHAEKMKKLEDDRMKRMTGLQEQGEEDADDLGEEFWAGSGDEGEGVAIEGDSDNAEESGSEDEEKQQQNLGRPKRSIVPAITMPSSYSDFATQTENMDLKQTLAHTKRILELYDPRLAEGNKQKVDMFVGILFQHILAVGNLPESDSLLVNELTHLLRTLAAKYNEALVEVIRATMVEVEERVIALQLEKKDIVFFVVLGYLFSTSDHYHLAVTPALILLNQFLSVCVGARDNLTVQQLGQGLLVCEILLSYQSFAKRFDPEVVKFLERAVCCLLPEPTAIQGTLSGSLRMSMLKLSKNYKPAPLEDVPLKVQSLFEAPKDENLFKFQLIGRALSLMDKSVSVWKEKSACIEVLQSFTVVLKVTARYYSAQLPKLGELIARFSKLMGNQQQSRKPLTLQEHKKMAIQTFAPKFEENFNPDKKSYDINRERQELNKVKAQVKKEKKLALKDIRKQTKFGARQQIEEKKEMYSDYHRKMANIVNSISTVEGAEKNQYEREKKKRQNQR